MVSMSLLYKVQHYFYCTDAVFVEIRKKFETENAIRATACGVRTFPSSCGALLKPRLSLLQ